MASHPILDALASHLAKSSTRADGYTYLPAEAVEHERYLRRVYGDRYRIPVKAWRTNTYEELCELAAEEGFELDADNGLVVLGQAQKGR